MKIDNSRGNPISPRRAALLSRHESNDNLGLDQMGKVDDTHKVPMKLAEVIAWTRHAGFAPEQFATTSILMEAVNSFRRGNGLPGIRLTQDIHAAGDLDFRSLNEIDLRKYGI